MAKVNLAACLAIVLAYEGGRVDDPHDPGGRTNEGVTQRTYDAWRHVRGLPGRDVYTLAPNERDAIYAEGYWMPIGGDDLPAGVDLATFDPAVNSGPAQARAWLAKARQAAGQGKAGQGAAPTAVITALCGYRLSFLHALRMWPRFGRGWGVRVAAIEAKAHRMALGSTPEASATIAALATNHRHAADAHRGRTKAAVAAASSAGVPAAATGHGALVLLIVALGLAVAGLAAFAAWRASQRAAALAHEAGAPPPA